MCSYNNSLDFVLPGEEVVQNCSPTKVYFVLNIAQHSKWWKESDLSLLRVGDGLFLAHFLRLKPDLCDQGFGVMISELELGFLRGQPGFQIPHLKKELSLWNHF